MLLNWDGEDCMRPGWIVIHQSRSSRPEVASSVQAGGQLLSVLDLFFTQAIDSDGAVLLLSNIDLVAPLTCGECLLQAIGIQQIIQFFIVYLQEAALYYEFGFAFALLNFVED